MSYYQTFVPDPTKITRIYESYAQAEELALSIARKYPRTPEGRQAARAARLIQNSYLGFRESLDAVAAKTASVANQRILAIYRQTRVRPDTGRAKHLSDALGTSVPIRTALPYGAVGIVNRAELDQFVYWPAQEFGSDTTVPSGVTYNAPRLKGRRLAGFFYQPGGRVRPNAGDFRKHALFEGTSAGSKGAIIKRSIKPGRFIRRGRDAALVVWTKEMDRAASAAAARLNAIMGQLNNAPIPRQRLGRAGGATAPARRYGGNGFRPGPRGFRP